MIVQCAEAGRGEMYEVTIVDVARREVWPIEVSTGFRKVSECPELEKATTFYGLISSVLIDSLCLNCGRGLLLALGNFPLTAASA